MIASAYTYMAINMLLCVVTGTPWAKREGFAGYRVGEARPVIMFAGEGADGVKQRINAAIEGGKFNRALVEKNLIFVPDVYTLNRADGLAGMVSEINNQDVKPALIVVDTFNLAHEGDENNAEDVKKSLRGLRELAIMYDAAGVVIDHVGHGNDTKNRQRGSYAKRANEDAMILCERADGKTRLTQEKNRGADKAKFVAAFIPHEIEIGIDPETKEPITDLWFEAVEPSQTQGLFKDQRGPAVGQWELYDDAAVEIMDDHSGPNISASKLADMTVKKLLPDVAETEPVKFAQVVTRYRQHLVRALALKPYVAKCTKDGGDTASMFQNSGLKPSRPGRTRTRASASAGVKA